MIIKPLHVVLKARWFDAFAEGRKTTEWRRHGRIYNHRVVTLGRPLVLRRGYTSTILRGHVTGARVVPGCEAPGDVLELFHCDLFETIEFFAFDVKLVDE
jgi:hypothetical protein